MAEDVVPTDTAEIKVIPPVIFSAYLAGGVVLAWIWGLPALPRVLAHGLGICLLIAAAAVVVSGFMAMKRQGTSAHPRTPTQALVTDGPYRYSRNPLYVSLVALYLALALLINSLWMALLTFALFRTLESKVIEPEERYLEAKFGDLYREYKAKVRRWL